MEFQVVAGKRLSAVHAGRSRVVFYFRKDMAAIAEGIEKHKTDTGIMKVSSPELTILDLLRYPHASGGINGIVTVLHELAPKADTEKLVKLCPAFERSVLQRTGYLLSREGFDDLAEKIHSCLGQGMMQWIELDRSLIGDPDFAPAILGRDQHWRVIIRQMPERDDV
jgi:hypothetical protein